jgi:NAD+ synthase (glutamine-hydrolysing)
MMKKTKTLRIVLAQLNFTLGDIQGNLQKHLKAVNSAQNDFAADLIVFSELSLTGYPPEDLLLRKDFLQETYLALNQFIHTVKDIYCIIGHPQIREDGLYNACSIIYQGKIIDSYAKQFLPNYGVFDEKRYFVPGHQPCIFSINEIQVGVVICEDLWQIGPIEAAAKAGAELIISPNASPFEINKHEKRLQILSKQIEKTALPIIYVNQIGGQDDLIFDGGSMLLDQKGQIQKFAGFFEEKLLPVDINESVIANETKQSSHAKQSKELDCNVFKNAPRNDEGGISIIILNKIARIYHALVLALRDYVIKNHFPGVIIGLSGGIDSALTLAIAVDALGKEKVQAIMLPSEHTSELSLKEAKKIAENLEVDYDILSIESFHQLFLDSLYPFFAHKKMKTEKDTTEENIQARCRAIILMALSNKSGRLVLSTTNHSEMAVGYGTLYGDLAGGFAVLKNVPKTVVYELAHYRNTLSPVIPPDTITRAPTAELSPNQTDEAALAPYPILDAILDAYINQAKSLDEIIALGFEKKLVEKILTLVRKSEYKRKQAPIGPHLDHHSFGKDWRYPITNGFKSS